MGYGTFKQSTCLRSTSAVLCLRWDLNLGRQIHILGSAPLDHGPKQMVLSQIISSETLIINNDDNSTGVEWAVNIQ